MKVSCWLVSCLLMLSTVSNAAGATERSRKAIFIIIDGVPADILEKTNTPSIDAISAAGGYTRAYVGGEIGGESESPTVSAVGYHSLLTGTWSNKHNVWTNDIKDPNYDYWDIFRIAKRSDESLHTALFSTWEENRTRLVGDGIAAAGGKKIDHHVDGLEHDTKRFPHGLLSRKYIQDIDEFVATQAAEYIEAQGPDLTWVYLEYTDDIGHKYGNGKHQTAALEFMDTLIGGIWKSIETRQQDDGEDWLIVITTDHGRDDASGRSHGRQSLRERTTWISTNSGRLNDNFRDLPAVVDIMPSIATHLELTMPEKIRNQLDGQSFID